MMVSAHTAYVLAKSIGNPAQMEMWPSFQVFLESLAQELIGECQADQAPRFLKNPARKVENHELEKLSE